MSPRPLNLLSLRARLMVLVLAGIVPLLAFDLGRQYLDYRAASESMGEHMLELARSLSRAVEQELNIRITALGVLALSPALASGDIAAFRETAEAATAAENLPGENVILLRRDGQQLMNTLVPRGGPLPIRPNLVATDRAFATASPAVSGVYRGAIGARWVVAIDVPVKRADGSVAYVLSINPRLDAFADVIRRQRLPSTWVATVFDRQGVIIARTRNQEQFVGAQASASLLPHFLNESEGVLDTTTLEGVLVLTGFSHAEASGWGVAVGVPKDELTEPVLTVAIRTLAVGGALLLIGLLLALLVSRQITRPIGALRSLAAALRGGQPLDLARTGLREADEVAETLRKADEERRAGEEGLQRVQSELMHVSRLSAMDQMGSAVAHEISQPLAAIANYLAACQQLLASTTPLPEAKINEILNKSVAQASRARQIIDHLRDFRAKARAQRRPETLSDVVDEAIQLTLLGAHGQNIHITTQIDPDARIAEINRIQIQQVLINLMRNAMEAMGETERRELAIRISAADEGMIEFELADTGPGLPAEAAAQLFKPFVSTKARGMGLGLSICRSIIDAHGGRIWAVKNAAGGTSFHFTVPRGAVDIGAA